MLKIQSCTDIKRMVCLKRRMYLKLSLQIHTVQQHVLHSKYFQIFQDNSQKIGILEYIWEVICLSNMSKNVEQSQKTGSEKIIHLNKICIKYNDVEKLMNQKLIYFLNRSLNSVTQRPKLNKVFICCGMISKNKFWWWRIVKDAPHYFGSYVLISDYIQCIKY